MEGKLVKTQEGVFRLYNDNYSLILGDSRGNYSLKLSIKNCEAIANGYDLDELAKEYSIDRHGELSEYAIGIYKDAFQKALEIRGDKKFSELDMRISYDAGCNNIDTDGDPIDEYNIDFYDTIQSLQQTEWDVEIITKPYTEVGEGFELEAKREPKLDKNGCLILKRL